MKPVYQTRFGGLKAPFEERGNCFQACVASILEIPLEEAFDCRTWEDETWFDKFNDWLSKYGLVCIAFDHNDKKPLACTEIKGYAIMECKSETLYHGEYHVVVIKDQEVVHDPNPNAIRVGECQGFYLFVPLDPARQIRLPSKV